MAATSTSTSPYDQWLSLTGEQITVDVVNLLLEPLQDDLWVASACVDKVVNDTLAQLSLINLGLSRTERAIQRCNDVLSLASPSLDPSHNAKYDTILSHFHSSPNDAQLCYLRSILLKRSDLLNTYTELENVFPKEYMDTVEADVDEWEDDPWADGNTTSTSKPTPQLKPAIPPLYLSDFLQNGLLYSACELASLQVFEALHILFRRHTHVLWPYRFKILGSIPEHADPATCRDLFPTLSHTTSLENVPTHEGWREGGSDLSEAPELKQAIVDYGINSIEDEHLGVAATPIPDCLTADQLSGWYKARVNSVISSAGLVDIALSLVQHASSQGIPGLDELGEELSLLGRLVYDAPHDPRRADDWTLDRWYLMDPLTVVRAYLSQSTPDTLPSDIQRLVMPYLFVLESRAERAGNPDQHLPFKILCEYILTTSLENVASIFENSKPTIPTSQRIIKDDEDMARIALACLYGSNNTNDWSTMSRVFECLPAWDLPADDEGEEADTTVASLGAFLTPKASQPPVTPKDLLVFFQPLPIASLSNALDILDVHLESGEILARWSVPARLSWLLQSSVDVKEQRHWANRMARRAGGDEDRLDNVEGWEWMLEDMLKLTGNGEPGFRGAFCLLPREEVVSIFFGGLLSTASFSIAEHMLHSPHTKLALPDTVTEDVCLAVSREFYDNATSGNYKTGDMKLAFDCLGVPKQTERIVKEREFIEATSRICSFNISSSPGVPISPIEIRLTKDRLNLISRVLSSNSDAYKHTAVILDLCYKLGFKDDIEAEVKVLAMLADTALQAEDFDRAYDNSERMMQIVSTLRNSRPEGVITDELDSVVDVCWITCFQIGRHPEFEDRRKKMTLLGHALEICPADKLHDVLSAWRKLEAEDLVAREEKLQQRQNGTTLQKPRKVESTAGNVASSLRARLQELHMPSPPMLNTPDAAALASKTFKTVAANFPFSVGHRGRSHASDGGDDRGSSRSDSLRRPDVSDVSAQASRVLSKGIGWLIGADDEV